MGFPDASSGCSEEPLNVVDVAQWENGAGDTEEVEDDVVALPDWADVMVVVAVTVVDARQVCDCDSAVAFGEFELDVLAVLRLMLVKK